ncbi:hypothetical protein DPM13_15435 [Paracoccus mutanolyticus]|uniref:Uncharacterized protein n=1 Tax=Paracoccus mutanolyticus TaxID=1499308 RepID=A0ABN5M8I9_9RHOB|nr:hypothetical protein DPM13_15435 [Paracoccus mutanolyticus]
MERLPEVSTRLCGTCPSNGPTLSQFSWFIAAGLGALFYYLIAPKGLSYADRDGESIAGPSASPLRPETIAMRHAHSFLALEAPVDAMPVNPAGRR